MENADRLRISGIMSAHATLLADIMTTTLAGAPDPIAALDAYAARFPTRRLSPAQMGTEPVESDVIAQVMQETVEEILAKVRAGLSARRPPAS